MRVANVTDAAELGSDVAAYRLGRRSSKAHCSLPKDPSRRGSGCAEIADGECKFEHSWAAELFALREWLRGTLAS